MLQSMMNSVRGFQYHMDDFLNEHPTTREEKLRQYFGISAPPSVPVFVDGRGVLKEVKPTCPKCGSPDHKLNGTNDKIVPRPYEEEKRPLKRQQYICRDCNNQYTTPFSDVRYREHLPSSLKKLGVGVRTRYNQSLRIAAEVIEVLTGYTMSHQTVWNAQREMANDTKTLSKEEPSGIYCFDVQHVKVSGEKAFRMTFVDPVNEQVLEEKVVSNENYKEKATFWKEVIGDGPMDAVITDGDTDIPDLIDETRKRFAKARGVLKSEVKIEHGRCVFHAESNLSEAAREALNTRNEDDPYPGEYKRPLRTVYAAFQLDNPEKLEEHLEQLPSNYRKRIMEVREEGQSTKDLAGAARKVFDIAYNQRAAFHPSVRRQLESIDRYWEEFTLFYRKSGVPKTNNPLESNYHATLSKTDKRKFKTRDGLQDYLRTQAWFRNRR